MGLFTEHSPHLGGTLERRHPPVERRITPPRFLDPQERSAVHELVASGLTPLQAVFATRRGIIDPISFIAPTADPASINFSIPGVRQATAVIREDLAGSRPFAVASDFDVDGVTSAAIMVTTLRALGAVVSADTPCRQSMGEGYGLNRRLIDDAVSKGCGTIIALDFGTTQHQMLRYAADQGLNTIVIDHHQLGRFPVPPADALINPHVSQREFREMCAAGLTWLFCQELCRDLGSAFDCRSTLSLAALATIADVVPLIGVNRSIVQHGLPLIPDHPGLEVLRKEAGLPRDLTSGDVAFQLGPMINAPGRILPFGARHCLDLLVGEPSKHLTAALELIDANRRRKERERIDTSRALGLIGSRPLQRGLVIESDFFDPGVVGLVASRLAERYARPTAIIACNSPQVGRASVRGALGFDVYEGLASCSHLFERFGGHKAAGGFAIQRAKIPELQRTFAAAVQQQLGVFQTPTIEADLFFDPQKISLAEAAEQLAAFEPFGNANEAPRVYLKQASITDIQSIGTEHFRVELRSGGITIDGYLWRGEGNSILKRKAGEEFPILGRVSSYLKPSGGSFSRTAAFEILAHG